MTRDPVSAVALLLILSFAAYRITRFLVKDSLIGMGEDAGTKMSVRVDTFAYTSEGVDRSWLRGKIGDLLTCSWCLGFHVAWVALCLWLSLWPWQLGFQGWLFAFAVAGGQGYLASRVNA